MMTDLPRTTIGQLVYRTAPGFDFARLVADLDGALSGAGVDGRRLNWDHDDVAMLDLGGSRIALSLAEGLGRARVTTVTVAAGFGPGDGDARLAQRQGPLARLIAERIASRFPPAETVWSESGDLATPDLLDRLADTLAARIDAEVAEERARRRPNREARRRRLAEPAEVARILARLEATLAARQAGRPDPEPLAAAERDEAASDSPDLPGQSRSGLEPVREALYPAGEDDRPSPLIRLAAHTLDATLMVVLLPAGAAMMTYSLARGADLRTSARMLALGGIGIGALHSMGGVAGLQALIQAI